MRSPFPGMNPYFEQADHWPDFQIEFLTSLRHQLDPEMGPDLIIQLKEHVYIHDLPAKPRPSSGWLDVSSVEAKTFGIGRTRVEILEAPAEVILPAMDVERIPSLEIRDRLGRELITVIELLSPSNKRPGEDRSQYLGKRRQVLRSGAHLVEIDLLRGWPPIPAEGRPEADYSVLVSRADRRPAAEFWPIRLRDRLPLIPIPLRAHDRDGRVDLQGVLDSAYDGPGYEKFIYLSQPEPPLKAADAEWAKQFVPERPRAGMRPGRTRPMGE